MMLLVVALHAAVPYLAAPVPRLVWAVRDGAWGRVLDGVFWACRGVAVPAFLVMAGMVAAGAIARRGPGSFAWSRLRRVGGALAAGLVTVLPVVYLVWLWGLTRTGRARPRHVLHGRFERGIEPELYGFAHLWYLEYLLLFAMAFAGVAWVARRMRLERGVGGIARWTVGAPWGAALLVPITAWTLWRWPEAFFAFRNTAIPQAGMAAYHAAFFAAGAAMWAARGRIGVPTRGWSAWLLAAAVAFGGMFWLMDGRAETGPAWGPRWVAWCAAAYTWCSVMGWLGACGRLRSVPRGVGWLARASYLMYVVHLPFVTVVQVAMHGSGVHPGVKWAMATGAGLAGGVGTAWVLERAGRWWRGTGGLIGATDLPSGG